MSYPKRFFLIIMSVFALLFTSALASTAPAHAATAHTLATHRNDGDPDQPCPSSSATGSLDETLSQPISPPDGSITYDLCIVKSISSGNMTISSRIEKLTFNSPSWQQNPGVTCSVYMDLNQGLIGIASTPITSISPYDCSPYAIHNNSPVTVPGPAASVTSGNKYNIHACVEVIRDSIDSIETQNCSDSQI
jgi:hypothetical protein